MMLNIQDEQQRLMLWVRILEQLCKIESNDVFIIWKDNGLMMELPYSIRKKMAEWFVGGSLEFNLDNYKAFVEDYKNWVLYCVDRD